MIEWLTDTLVMTGALMALVLLVRRPVGRWFGPGAAYALWGLPMLRLVLPPLALPRGLVPLPKVSIEPIVAGATTFEPMVVDPDAAMTAPVASVAIAEPGLLAQVPWAQVLLAIWLAGAVGFLAWRTWNYFTMRRELLAGARQVASAEGVRIVESPAAAAPLAFGVFDKVVALPQGFLANTDSESSDFAIAHELEHHGGNDLLAIIAMQPLFALHWFNPLAWAAWRAVRSDQEAACDARVMAGRDRAVRARYGQLIASYAAGTRLALAAPMAGPLTGDKPIIHRLKALSSKDVSPARRVLGRGLFAIAVVSVPVTATVSYAANEVPEGPGVSGIPEVPAVPAVPAVPTVDVAQPPEVPLAPEAPLAPEVPLPTRWSDAEPAEPAPPVPPVPPVPPAPEDRVWIARQEARHAEIEARAERAAARARRQTAEAERRAAEAERMAAEAMAHAPRVEETVTADGKRKIVRIVRTNKAGKREVTQEMILDSGCPADSGRGTARAGQDASSAATVVCTGTPSVTMTAAIKALAAAREAIASDRNLKADVRVEILSDLDGEIADAQREIQNANW